MTRLAALFLLAAVSAAPAVPDVTPNAPRLELTRGATELRGGLFIVQVEGMREDKDGRMCASLLLFKNDLDHGRLSVYQSLYVGDSLGLTSKPDPKERPKFPRELWAALTSENPVDFDPQTKLVLARRYPEWPIRRCLLVDMPDGPGCMGFSEWRAKVPVLEVILEEKSGRRITLRAPSHRDKMPPDTHCSVHGGRLRARLVTESEKNTVNAEYFLSEADEYWKSRNPKLRKLAQESYLKLLKEFPTEALVVRNLERIKARAAAEIETED